MRHRKYIKGLVTLSMMILLTLSGCGNTDSEGSKDVSEGNKTEESSNDKDDKIVSVVGSEYRELICERSKTEGKFAVYFISTQTRNVQWTNTDLATGDSVLLIAPDGTTMLVDASVPIAAREVVTLLQDLGIEKIDYFVNSHGHVDHCGGFATVARYFEIGHVYSPNDVVLYYGGASPVYSRSFMKEVEELGISHTYLAEGDTFQFGQDVKVDIYNPPVDYDYSAGINANESSLVMKFTYGDSTLLLTGDIGDDGVGYKRATETELAEKYGNALQADITKMNHHGQNTSSSDIWRSTVNAKLIVAQTDFVRDEMVVLKYLSEDTETLLNCFDGTVLVYTTGDGTYDVQVEAERYTDNYGTLDTVDGHFRIE